MLKQSPAFNLVAALTAQLETAANALEGPHPDEAVHRGRTGLKRARALAHLARKAEPHLSEAAVTAIRPIMRSLSAARDLTALEAAAKAAADEAPTAIRPTLLGAARKLNAKRKLAVEAPTAIRPTLLGAARKLNAKRKLAVEAPLAAAASDTRALAGAVTGWPPVSTAALEAGAARLARRAKRAYAKVCKSKSEDDRHEWRQREKERLYAVLLLGPHWPASLPRRRRSAQRLGEALGRERDLSLLMDLFRQDPSLSDSPDEADRVLAALAKLHDKARKRADKLGKRVHRS
ncbi:MAG: CHAD domain-containing protein [Hyphomonadaceae bacterium]